MRLDHNFLPQRTRVVVLFLAVSASRGTAREELPFAGYSVVRYRRVAAVTRGSLNQQVYGPAHRIVRDDPPSRLAALSGQAVLKGLLARLALVERRRDPGQPVSRWS